MAENTLWNTVSKRLREALGVDAYEAWRAACSPEFASFEDNIFSIRVAGQGGVRPIGGEIVKILNGMGFVNASVQFLSARETVIVTHDPIKDIYEEIVRPDRALSLPGYIQRWVEQQIGVDGFFMAASLKQISYEAGSRGEGAMYTARFSAQQIAVRAGISIRTYWNRLSDDGFWKKLKGLAVKHDDPKTWVSDGGKPRQAARRFSVFTTMPLTPSDAAHLRRWLLENAEAYGGPEGVLRAAADTPMDDLIGNGDGPAEDAMTVLELVSSLFRSQVEPKLLAVLASNLHRHIIRPRDIIRIPLFFLEYILPALGPSAGYLLVLMRDRCFVNQEISRTIVTFQGGWDEIAAKLGLAGDRRAKTAWEWLNAKYPASHKEAGKYRNAIARMYMAEVIKDEPELDFEHQPRTFRVLTDEIPRDLLEVVVTGRGPYAGIFQSDFCTHGMADFSQSGNCTLGMADFALSDGAYCTHAMADFALILKKVAQLKALKLLNQLLNTNRPTPAVDANEARPDAPPASGTNGEGGRDAEQTDSQKAVGQSVWDFSRLAQTSDIHPSKVSVMVATVPDEQERALRFVGWILHAHSPKGKTLKDETGVGLAISSIGTRPGNAFMRLARLGPEKLRALFDGDLAHTLGEKTAEEMIYRANLKKLPLHRKQDLYYRLFAEDAPESSPAPRLVIDTMNADTNESPKSVPFKVPRRKIKVVE
ncbi:MAG: hypothetical protein QY332_10125 [Anaerolineales bacterium]|nr:MAG: hypothetical protein QY332_10125 [Anaerolineales bacterium]